jgi:hypothetical protein
VERRAREVSERERRAQFEELTLLQTRDFELCCAVVGPPWVKHHWFKGMHLAALRHTKMVVELAAHWVAGPTVVESVLGRPHSDSFRVEVVDELASEFQKNGRSTLMA